MTISKNLDFSAGSKFAIKLPQDIRYDRESQNLSSIFRKPILNLADTLTVPYTGLADKLVVTMVDFHFPSSTGLDFCRTINSVGKISFTIGILY